MIRAAVAPAITVISTSVAAQAELPSPLFCETVAICAEDGTCTPPEAEVHFVLRRTGGEWVMQASPRGPDTWVILGDTEAAVLEAAPEGARVGVVAAGEAPDGILDETQGGAILLHQHLLEPGTLSAAFQRHACRPSSEGTT